ncbi:YrbL family protein [Sulfurimonas paralvinellae]|uniref:PhoP regulatory network protein YrbL n=1 Tax=Sulfurimonas paralvinellae TaxID=317658 RepID=A0A7M1B8R3_9BACT|nr:YrbL family protein [Sulfurimonas paralvinellae]QOP46110.1 hypothetical protein FM071_07335 [Sulfurimonas paralvinellae]
MITLPNEILGKGNERVCYLHPQDPEKIIKISYDREKGRSKQSDIEITYYKELQKRKNQKNLYKHLPRFYGEIETDKGKGMIVDLVKDFDGTVSKSFEYYMKRDGIKPYRDELEEYKQYFLDNLIIFNYGMMPKNILRRRLDENNAELVLIDGLGDVAFFKFPNKIPYFARKKILRRWIKFFNKYIKD